MNRLSVFEKYPFIHYFFVTHLSPEDPDRFKWLSDIDINRLEISPIQRKILFAGIQSLLKQSRQAINDATLERFAIIGASAQEIINSPILLVGNFQRPNSVPIEHSFISALLTGELPFCGGNNPFINTGSKFLSACLSNRGGMSEVGKKLFAKAVLEEPDLILSIKNSENGHSLLQEIEKDHIEKAIEVDADLNAEALFKVFKSKNKEIIFNLFEVKNEKQLFNIITNQILNNETKKKISPAFLKYGVSILQKMRDYNLANRIKISSNTENNITFNRDVTGELFNYLPAQDIISLVQASNIEHPQEEQSNPDKLKQAITALGHDEALSTACTVSSSQLGSTGALTTPAALLKNDKL